jgi:hypothetical protein
MIICKKIELNALKRTKKKQCRLELFHCTNVEKLQKLMSTLLAIDYKTMTVVDMKRPLSKLSIKSHCHSSFILAI